MTQEIATRALVPDLKSGEVVDLLEHPERIPEILEQLRERRRLLNEWTAAVTETVAEIARRSGTKTLNLGGRKVSLGGDTELSWDVTELRKLLDLGLPQARYDELVTEEVSYKVNASVAKQIAAANPDYAAVVERARTVLAKRGSVKL